jgi:hypothetical protein
MSQSVTLCQTVHDLLVEAADGPDLSAHQIALVDRHLTTCSACRQDGALRTRATASLAAMPVLTPDPARQEALRQKVARRGPGRRRDVRHWLTTPVPAYGAVAAALVLFALAGALKPSHDMPPLNLTLAAVADTSLPAPVLTQADSYNVLANIRLLDGALQTAPLLTDSLDRAVFPGTQL